MKIGFVGLGKLGLPCALATESRGHEVRGTDPDPRVAQILASRRLPYREAEVAPLLQQTRLQLVDLTTLVRESELLFVCVQTPHQPLYEGITPIPDSRADFDYAFLRNAIAGIAAEVDAQGVTRVVNVVCTVLPTTIAREVRPLLGRGIRLTYNPLFIAMGTTVPDFLHPEFVLLGADDAAVGDCVESFYRTLTDRPVMRTTVESAELIKVAYNTFIGMKIAFANTMLEICDRVGADVDEVTRAMSLATRRLLSPQYLRGGMGDGGGCHPRDNIALSWLARELELSHDLFDDVMKAREHQTARMADVLCAQPLPKVVLGKAFKRGSNITTGSAAMLLAYFLRERGVAFDHYDPHVDGSAWPQFAPSAFFIATDHDEFASCTFPPGSIVIDPWGIAPERPGVAVMRLGRRRA